MKKIFLFLLLIFVIFLFSGCTSDITSTEDTNTQKDPNIKNTIDLNDIKFEDAQEYLELESDRIGKVQYKKIKLTNGSYYYILNKTEGIFKKISEINKEPFTKFLTKNVSFKDSKKPENVLEDIYTQNDTIDTLLKSIDKNYGHNFNKKLTDQEMWAIVKNLFDWYKNNAETGDCPVSMQYVESSSQNIDHLSTQAELFKDTGKICLAACIQGGFVTYALLTRLGIPRDKLIVANLAGNWPLEYFSIETDENGITKKVPNIEKIKTKMTGMGLTTIEDFFAYSAGHYYTALQIGNQWYAIDGLAYSCIIPETPIPIGGAAMATQFPFRVFVLPQKENCTTELELGCQETPLGVPLLTKGPQLNCKTAK
ncbi:MAG: hypothetical protein PHH82_03995 [Candidatus ainarchaeum sp.]|nr:hypothetical protein [Candidatus ainarchaeum sp.]